jgi:hypothetical protein
MASPLLLVHCLYQMFIKKHHTLFSATYILCSKIFCKQKTEGLPYESPLYMQKKCEKELKGQIDI